MHTNWTFVWLWKWYTFSHSNLSVFFRLTIKLRIVFEFDMDSFIYAMTSGSGWWTYPIVLHVKWLKMTRKKKGTTRNRIDEEKFLFFVCLFLFCWHKENETDFPVFAFSIRKVADLGFTWKYATFQQLANNWMKHMPFRFGKVFGVFSVGWYTFVVRIALSSLACKSILFRLGFFYAHLCNFSAQNTVYNFHRALIKFIKRFAFFVLIYTISFALLLFFFFFKYSKLLWRELNANKGI